jgi:hypothetical protein
MKDRDPNRTLPDNVTVLPTKYRHNMRLSQRGRNLLTGGAAVLALVGGATLAVHEAKSEDKAQETAAAKALKTVDRMHEGDILLKAGVNLRYTPQQIHAEGDANDNIALRVPEDSELRLTNPGELTTENGDIWVATYVKGMDSILYADLSALQDQGKVSLPIDSVSDNPYETRPAHVNANGQLENPKTHQVFAGSMQATLDPTK